MSRLQSPEVEPYDISGMTWQGIELCVEPPVRITHQPGSEITLGRLARNAVLNGEAFAGLTPTDRQRRAIEEQRHIDGAEMVGYLCEPGISDRTRAGRIFTAMLRAGVLVTPAVPSDMAVRAVYPPHNSAQ